MVYHIKIAKWNGDEWSAPLFPKSCKNLDILREDAMSLLRVYSRVGIFLGDELIEELVHEVKA